MRYLIAGLLLVPVAAIQAAVFSRISIFGGAPNLILLLVVTWAIVRGSPEGMFWGFVGGLLFDLANAGPVGVSALSLVAVAGVAGIGGRAVFGGNLLLPVLMTFLATMLYVALNAFLLATLHFPTDWRMVALEVAIPSGLANALFAIAIYPLLAAVDSRTRGQVRLAV